VPTIYGEGDMKIFKDVLALGYRNRACKASKECLSSERLASYAAKKAPRKERADIERHLSGCYYCLDAVLSIKDGLRFFNNNNKTNRRNGMKRFNLFLIIAIVSFVLSFVFKGYFLQFLAATFILSMKWIVDTKTNRILIAVYDAWKRGGEKETGRVLTDLESRNRIEI